MRPRTTSQGSQGQAESALAKKPSTSPMSFEMLKKDQTSPAPAPALGKAKSMIGEKSEETTAANSKTKVDSFLRPPSPSTI